MSVKRKECEDIKVFGASKAVRCNDCKKIFRKKSLIVPYKDKKVLCLKCYGLDKLSLLPSGDAALTRRAKKYSKRYAIVLNWVKRRKRFERLGILVEEKAIIKAKNDCSADAGKRKINREKAAIKREIYDKEYIKTFTLKIRQQYPSMPKGKEIEIAKHACEKYSGRVGRSAKAKELNNDFITLAVIAHIRHTETKYDQMLDNMMEKTIARKKIYNVVKDVLELWERE